VPRPIEIAQDKQKITLKAELYEFTKDQIQIHVENNVLTIRGERSFDQFVRSFRLTNVDLGNIKASFRNGLLKIEMPNGEEGRTSQIAPWGEGGLKQTRTICLPLDQSRSRIRPLSAAASKVPVT
jgi:hypothetical protein